MGMVAILVSELVTVLDLHRALVARGPARHPPAPIQPCLPAAATAPAPAGGTGELDGRVINHFKSDLVEAVITGEQDRVQRIQRVARNRSRAAAGSRDQG